MFAISCVCCFYFSFVFFPFSSRCPNCRQNIRGQRHLFVDIACCSNDMADRLEKHLAESDQRQKEQTQQIQAMKAKNESLSANLIELRKNNATQMEMKMEKITQLEKQLRDAEKKSDLASKIVSRNALKLETKTREELKNKIVPESADVNSTESVRKQPFRQCRNRFVSYKY